MAFYLAISGLLSLLLILWAKERILYVIFPWAYVQNFILAWAYTSGWAGKELCQALLISKEFLLLWLFLYFIPRVPRHSDSRWLTPLKILGFFVAWCVVRYAIAVVFQGDSLFGNLWDLRIVFFPIEILVVAMAISSAKPEFARRFILRMTWLAAALAVLAIPLCLLSATNFWRDHANIAAYTTDVKGQSSGYEGQAPEMLAEATGISGNGLARGAFVFLSPFRAFGTIGDSVGFGHFVAFPLLLLAFCFRRNWKRELVLSLIGIALFLSFTRSAWIFVAVAAIYVLLRRHRFKLVFGLGGAGALAVSAWAPLGEWYSASLGGLSTSSTDPHANGLIWFYTQGLWKFENLFGQGMTADVPESGYGILLIRYGLPAVLILIWFCFVLYRELRQTNLRGTPLFLVAQAVPIGMLVILNFSYYPFSFIPYLLVWFVVGFCLVVANENRRDRQASKN
jgi:hypothetical protein